jgi:hypothetical protein
MFGGLQEKIHSFKGSQVPFFAPRAFQGKQGSGFKGSIKAHWV